MPPVHYLCCYQYPILSSTQPSLLQICYKKFPSVLSCKCVFLSRTHRAPSLLFHVATKTTQQLLLLLFLACECTNPFSTISKVLQRILGWWLEQYHIEDMTLDDNLCIGTVTYGWDGRIILARPHISVIAPQTFVWWTIRHSCSTISCPIFLIYQEYFCDRVNINIYDTQRPLPCENDV